jgi:hypothetical protein
VGAVCLGVTVSTPAQDADSQRAETPAAGAERDLTSTPPDAETDSAASDEEAVVDDDADSMDAQAASAVDDPLSDDSIEPATTDTPLNAADPSGASAIPMPTAPPGELLGYDLPRVARWRLGLVLESGTSACTGVMATLPVPRDWPEQNVKLVSEQLDPYVTAWDFRELENGVRQIVLTMSSVPPGTEATAIWEFEIERSRILPPSAVEELRIPTKLSRDLKQFLGNSPFIETNNAKIRKVARELKAAEPESDWAKVEQIYDWVRDNVQYREGPIRSAAAALKDKWGDCEDMTSLFVALCRNRGIPARMVWIPGHCYPEFYLEKEPGEGAWFPCQVAGTRQFGSMDEPRPVLQKGDRFKVPEKDEPQRYVAEFLKVGAVRGSGRPTPRFIRELVNPGPIVPATPSTGNPPR